MGVSKRVAALVFTLASGCSSTDGASGSGGATAATSNAATSNAASSNAASATAASSTTASGTSTGAGGAAPADTLGSNRDRLLGTYLDFLEVFATAPQSNGLSGANVADVCDVWQKLDPSSKTVFLTITTRLQRSVLGADGSSMLRHVTKLYRVTGGQGATAADPGSCGGGEYNRMIMSMDEALHGALSAANDHQGATQGFGLPDLVDAPPTGTFWRDSHDLGGAHAPFDRSDETETGAPRGQTQYFADPSSALATTALGRQDLATLVDPYALEMDQDYNCIHDSNPLCAYTTYGPFCLPEASTLGAQLFAGAYGDYDASWKPTGCP